MNPRISRRPVNVPSLVLVAALAFQPTTAQAEVTRVVIEHCADVLGGKSWGATGAYEWCKGRIFSGIGHPNALSGAEAR